jgi:hypothetical protein
LTTRIFFLYFFSFLLFFILMSFVRMFWFFLFLVCDARLIMIVLETNVNPLKNIFYNFVSLLACKCFGSFLIVHKFFINVLYHT